jgi:signal recognition particle receptor subunit beta
MDEWVRQAQVWTSQAEGWVRQQPPEQIYVAAAVVALTILVLIAGAESSLSSFSPPIVSN